jgi:hypothetical protein
MFIFLGILLGVILYIVGAGATHGYAKYRWPSAVFHYGSMDDSDKRIAASVLWPFYWTFIWSFTKVNEITFSRIEKEAAMQIAKNKTRVADLEATRVQVEASNAELEQAEVELEKEIGKL